MAGRNITHKNCSTCLQTYLVNQFSKTQLKKPNPSCSNCCLQKNSPLTVGSAFAPITPPMAGGHPRPAPAAPAGGWSPTTTTGFRGVANRQQHQQFVAQPGTLYQPFGAATPPSHAYGAGPAVASPGGVGFGQQATTVGFAAAAAHPQPSPLGYPQHQHQQQHQQQQQQFPGGFGGHPQVQAQRQLFAGAGGGGGGFDTSAKMEDDEELWLGQFAPQGGVQFATFQHQFAQQQQVARAAAAAGVPAPDPRAIKYLTEMAAKGFTAQVQKAIELCKNDINKASLVFQKSAKGLGAVQKMKGGIFKGTVTTAIAAQGGCLVRAWAQIEQAYKVVASVQKRGGAAGQTAAGKALQMANNDLVQAAQVLLPMIQQATRAR